MFEVHKHLVQRTLFDIGILLTAERVTREVVEYLSVIFGANKIALF